MAIPVTGIRRSLVTSHWNRQHRDAVWSRTVRRRAAGGSDVTVEPPRPLRLSCADHCFGPIPHSQRFERARHLGFDAVDIVVIGGYTWLQPQHVRSDPIAAAAAVRHDITRLALDIADVFVIPSFDFSDLAVSSIGADSRDDARAWFRDMLAFTEQVGSSGMTVLPGVAAAGQSADDALGRAADELAWRVEVAAERGIAVSVEPHVDSLIERPDRVQWLLDATPGLRLTLDHTHFVAQGDRQSLADPFISSARHIQTRGARPGRTQTTLADSTMDFGALVAALREHDYDGYVGIEYGWTRPQHENHLDAEAESVALRRELVSLSTRAGFDA